MVNLTRYLDEEAIRKYGFKNKPDFGADTIDGKHLGVYFSTYYSPNSKEYTRLIIGELKDKRGKTEWYFISIPELSRKDSLGPRNDEVTFILRNTIKRKNRVAGKNLKSRLEEATKI